ncbi:Cof-type HAD-IIB family hydrolase [Pseudalkalibacillus berkeleyi]|uniref:Cof-type HAD-IIB family hydrolase n=1 Tax=Pseudalkalibacillus berkeleyi TaxID=1069813 RepID=A0ABS9GZ13_9BACL|nr:Cof-type HAD-IIB family hydrolase [Pseudalkalibacillus berkeleyi]MCF6136935.1 Cof-type HAD-IIB family hydrolase [Pseudalkalibacillus berkeleyi]
MNNKIVFFDIDGTLLDHDKKLPKGTVEAIKELDEKNIPMIIATGRAPFMFSGLRSELGIQSFVSFNGQYVSCEGECVFENPLDETILKQLVTQSSEHDHPMVFLNTKEGRTTHVQHPHVQKSMDDLKLEHPKHDPDFYQGRSIFQALLYCDNNEKETFYRNAYQDFNFIRWHQYSIDVLPRTGSKAVGIEKMIEHLGYRQEDVIAFGDGLNDLEMLEYAGTGVAMGNAKNAAKKSADFITKAVDEDGIRYGLKHIGLID